MINPKMKMTKMTLTTLTTNQEYNPSNTLQVHVASEDKTSYLIQVSGSNYRANTLFINESGFYSLILSSKLPQAKAFKRWVTRAPSQFATLPMRPEK